MTVLDVQYPRKWGLVLPFGWRLVLVDSAERELVRVSLESLRRRTGFPMVFVGSVSGAHCLRLEEFRGNITTALSDVGVRAGRGLGGRAVAMRRPAIVNDYHQSATITHDYDAAVRAERLWSALAVPVIVDGVLRSVLYGGFRNGLAIGAAVVEAAVDVGRRLEQQIVVEQEVRRRLDQMQAPLPADGPTSEELREIVAELRALRTQLDGHPAQDRICQMIDRMDGGVAHDSLLTSREIDVLAWVALGCTNAEIADALGLSAETVKSYVRNLMRKLGARTRMKAVVEARRRGVLP